MTRTLTITGVLLASLGASPALSQTSRVIDLGSIGGPTQASSVNASGVVAGASLGDVASGSRYHAFRWRGVLEGIDPLAGDLDSHAFAVTDSGMAYGMSFSVGRLGARTFAAGADGVPVLVGDFAARGANNSGALVGSQRALTPNGLETRNACEFRDGTLLVLPGLGGESSAAAAITENDLIVGWVATVNGMSTHAALWRDGAVHDLGTLGGSRSQALHANSAGVVVGVSQTPGGQMHAFAFQTDSSGGVVSRQDLGTLGGGASTAMGINNVGTVVGTSDDRAFVFASGQMTDLNASLPSDSGWLLPGAAAINDRGLVAGWGKHHGVPAAFLFTPCGADFDNNGTVDTRDVLAFLNAWVGRAPVADFNDDGIINTQDVLAFLNAWNAG
ncbi:MAG: GC-type dockerin domain-anchored protein, partial [Phycisphaerales bacterium JB041]